MSLATIVLIILVIALLGGFSGIGGGRFYGTGYYGGGGLGLVIVILLILILLGKSSERQPYSNPAIRATQDFGTHRQERQRRHNKRTFRGRALRSREINRAALRREGSSGVGSAFSILLFVRAGPCFRLVPPSMAGSETRRSVPSRWHSIRMTPSPVRRDPEPGSSRDGS